MKLPIIKIGNSQGIRIPQSILKQCNIQDSVNISIEDNAIIITPDVGDAPRKGWAEEFKKMASHGDDALLDSDIIESDFDKKEWEW